MTPLELQVRRTELLEAASELARLLDKALCAGDRTAARALELATVTLVSLGASGMLPEFLDEPLEREPASKREVAA